MLQSGSWRVVTRPLCSPMLTAMKRSLVWLLMRATEDCLLEQGMEQSRYWEDHRFICYPWLLKVYCGNGNIIWRRLLEFSCALIHCARQNTISWRFTLVSGMELPEWPQSSQVGIGVWGRGYWDLPLCRQEDHHLSGMEPEDSRVWWFWSGCKSSIGY